MGKYAREQLLASLDIAERMINTVTDKYSLAYWLCMHWMVARVTSIYRHRRITGVLKI